MSTNHIIEDEIYKLLREDESHGIPIYVRCYNEEHQKWRHIDIHISEMLQPEFQALAERGFELCCVAKNIDNKALIDFHFVECR